MLISQSLVFFAALALAMLEAYRGGFAVTVLALVTTLPWVWFFCPRKHLAVGLCFCAAFFLEPSIVILAEKLNGVFDLLAGHSPFPYYFLRVGLVEELAKFSAVLFVIKYFRLYPKDTGEALIYAAAAALGFATGENFFKLHHITEWNTAYTAYSLLIGLLVRVPLHVLLSSIWGMHLISYSKQPSKLISVPIAVALLATMALHAWWDTIAVLLWHDAALTAELLIMLAGLWCFYLHHQNVSNSRTISSRNEHSDLKADGERR